MGDTIKIGNLDISAFKVGSSDCKIYLGDTLLYEPTYKLVAQYSDTTEYKVVCDGSTTLSTTDTRGHTTPISAMTSAVVNGGGCVTQIGINAFSGATSLTSLTLSDGITTFNNQAFIEMHSLESFTFPSTLTTFAGSVFRFSNIKKFNNKIPSGVTYLSSGALADMYKLTGMTIPATITGSSTNLFLRDSGLTQVHFEGTTPPALGANAFNGCTALNKIYIPNCNCFNSYAAQSQFSGLTSIIYAEGTNTKCQTTTPSIKMTQVNSWIYSADTNSNVYSIQKSASTTGELTTCSIAVSGITSIVFKIAFSNNSSGINFSSSKDNYASSTTLKTVNSTWTLSGLTSSSKYTIKCKLIKRSGTYVSGTGAGAGITWS